MSMTVLYGLIAIYLINGLMGTWYLWAVHSERWKKYRIRTPEVDRISVRQRLIVIPLNMTFSLALIAGFLYLFAGHWISYEKASGLTIFGETLAVLLMYDFIYYWFHRVFHHRNLMKLVHGVHHRARFPTAWDGLYLNPVENFAGLGILFLAITIFSPINVVSFLLVIFFHTMINILVHTNMVLPHPAFKLFNYWAVKHDIHHGTALNKNFSNIFPYWDMMFGSYK